MEHGRQVARESGGAGDTGHNGFDRKANTKDVRLRLAIHNFIVLVFGVLDMYVKAMEYLA